MHLLICHNEYGAMSGEEHALQSIADMLEEHGHKVSWFLRSSAEIKGLTGKALAFCSGIHNPRSIGRLRRLLRQQTFDAALVQNLYPFLSSSLLPVFRDYNIPVIMRCPNYRLFCPNGLHLSRNEICERCLGGREYWCILRNCENSLLKSVGYAVRNAVARKSRRIMNNVDVFVVLSEFQRRRFVDGGIPAERLEIASNVAPRPEEMASGDPGDLVSFVGRVSPEKGIEDFLAAAERLPEIPFAVAGNHDRMPYLRGKAPSNLRWLGFLKGGALSDFYRQTRILVFPSRCFEGFPNVIADAMMSGKPVIASRLGAVPEIVEHGRTGWLFEPGNVAEMTGAIQRLYASPDECLRMGRAGRIKAETRYGREIVYERWREIMEKVQMVARR